MGAGNRKTPEPVRQSQPQAQPDPAMAKK
jgi:hypothetical protein